MSVSTLRCQPLSVNVIVLAVAALSITRSGRYPRVPVRVENKSANYATTLIIIVLNESASTAR